MRAAGVPAFAASLCRKRLSCASITERSTSGVGTPPEAPLLPPPLPLPLALPATLVALAPALGTSAAAPPLVLPGPN